MYSQRHYKYFYYWHSYPPATEIIQKKGLLSTLQKLIAEQQLPDKFLLIPHMKQLT